MQLLCRTLLLVFSLYMVNSMGLTSLDEYSFELYNKLASVEEANMALASKNASFDEFLEEAKEIAKRYDVSEFMGVRLLHRHTTVGKDAIMIEKYEHFNEEESLVTRPQDYLVAGHATPASWLFNGTDYKVFEYSYDKNISKAFEVLKNVPEFFDEFALLLLKYQYQDVIAPAIVCHEWDNRYDAHHIAFVERSYENPTFASVVTAEAPESLELDSLITTIWRFENPFNVGCYKYTYCFNKWDRDTNEFYHETRSGHRPTSDDD